MINKAAENMAQNFSPNTSPTMASYNRAIHTRSPTPPPLPQSKRDKRRFMFSERLTEMINSFSANQHDHYFAQLSAIQCDINLIMRADPFNSGPLEDSPEAIGRLVDEARREATRNRQISSEAEESFEALRGRHYSQFVNEVNTALEERDAALTMAFKQYEEGRDELRRTNQYKVQLAHEEHQLLSKTLRERLIQSVTQKKARLLRDKEQLDIADSNALLLNPNQFSLGNPASPGGAQNPRKTRHSRLRPGEGEEVGLGAVQENNKRKRKAAIDENDHDSPAPPVKMADNRLTTPFRDARAKQIHSQYEAPVYSIDRLFTEKELAMNITRAHLATSEFFARVNAQQPHATASVNGTTTGSVDLNGSDGTASALPLQDGRDPLDHDIPTRPSPSLLAALPTTTTTSAQASAHAQTYHATRSTQRGAASGTNALDSLANAATALAPFAIVAPFQPILVASKTGPPHAPPVPGLSEAEVTNDLQMMKLGPEDPIIRRLTELCVERPGVLPVVAGGPWSQEGLVGMVAPGNEVGQGFAGAQVMGRQGSAMGYPSAMGMAMGMGPVAMSRNASMMSEGGGYGGVSAADFGVRTRRMG